MTINSLQCWLSDYFKSTDFVMTPLVGDASFRQYFRIHQPSATYIAVDASPEREKCPQFIAIADALRKKGLYTPEIFAKELASGFLLLTDFGDKQLLKIVNSDNQEILYSNALSALATLSACKDVKNYSIPRFTSHFMREELNVFQQWFLEKHIELELSVQTRQMLSQCFDRLAESCAAQPYVFMHRDYHSANLMLLADQQIGILDFQDAFVGPVTYDLVSLLRDCYLELPHELVIRLALQYRDMLALKISDVEFLYWFDCMGIQRHLKALLTFARKYRRDNNAHYLQYIPRTLNYVLHTTERHPEYAELNQFLHAIVLEKVYG
jgi:N-acetylmuramate 1-kinase